MSYINKFNNVCVLTTNNFNNMFDCKENYNAVMKKMSINMNEVKIYPLFSNDCNIKEKILTNINNSYKKIAIMTFLNNIWNDYYCNLDLLEKYNIPFIFTLYPGGGLILNDSKINNRLKRIFDSKMFRKVIVTQPIVEQYLLINRLCDPSKIIMIQGVVTPKAMLNQAIQNKLYYGANKNKLDICFVAHKYCNDGKDKGYPLFIESAKILCKKYNNINFHVVGEFDKNTLDISDISNNITFYGTRDTEWFKTFYLDKDIILSPNIPFVLSNGSIDGFPTGAATEAMLNKVLLMATDELKQNSYFTDKKDIFFIRPNINDIVRKIELLYKKPSLIKNIAEEGYKTVNKYYSFEKQILPRINIITEELKK